MHQRFDVLIRGGHVYDGSGAPGKLADVAVSGDRIAAIGPSLTGDAATVIDATGLAVAPGFIDVKTHSDFSLPVNPTADSKIMQGVTTEIIGHCGFTAAPVLPGKVPLLTDYLSALSGPVKFKETSFSDYMNTFRATSVNVGMLIGYNTMRLMAMGMESRAPNADELAAMIAMLEDGLQAGALGLSAGLFTTPGSYARRDDLVAFGRVLHRHRAGYFFHLRDESFGVVESVQEVLDLAETCDVHAQICHFKCSGLDSWGKAEQIAEMVLNAKARGIQVDLDLYPYTAAVNPLRNLLPIWSQAGGTDAMVERLKEPEIRQRIRADIQSKGLTNFGHIPSWDNVQISTSPSLGRYAGRTIGALAAELGKDPLDLVCDALIADRCATLILVFSISEDDIRYLLRSSFALVGSDGNCVSICGPTREGKPHPRFFGTFPRVLGHYVDELHVLPLEQAIHKMTGASARAMRLQDRGLLEIGMRADITVFDPAGFKERSTYEDPFQYPGGERTHVLVNGAVVVRDSRHTGALPGSILRRTSAGAVL